VQQPRRMPGRPGSSRSRISPARAATPARAGRPRASGQTRGGVPTQVRVAADQVRSASRPASARRAAAAGAAKRTRPPQPNRFTGRATVLAFVLGALLLAYAYPVRIYLNQQAQIASLQASQAAQRQRIKDLSDQSAKWNDPEYVTAQARSRLQMVKPGDIAYLIIDPGAAPASGTDPDAGRAKNTGPWYAQLWSSVQAADKPRARS
jgi:cell division protein FtsB